MCAARAVAATNKMASAAGKKSWLGGAFNALLLAVLASALCACSGVEKEPLPRAPAPVVRSKPAREANFSLSQRKLLEIISEQNRFFERSGRNTAMSKNDSVSLQRKIESLWAEYLIDNPRDADALIIYGKFLRSTGENSRAYAAFKKADSIDGEIAVVKQQMATYEAEEGIWREAYADMKKAVELEPDNPVYLTQLAQLILIFRQVMMNDGGYEQADLDAEMISCYARAAELQPDSVQAQRNYALAFYDVGKADWNAALAQWEKVLSMAELNLEKQTALTNKARVLIELNRDGEAEEVLEGVTLPALLKPKMALISIVKKAKKEREKTDAAASAAPGKKLYSY